MALTPAAKAAINKKRGLKPVQKSPAAGKPQVSKATAKPTAPKAVQHAGFFHVEVYSKKAAQAPKAKRASARTIHAIMAEVSRDEEYSRHVPKEKTAAHPPELVFSGLDEAPVEAGAVAFAAELERYIDQRLEQGEKTFQKKVGGELRTIKTGIDPTQSALVAGVISLPADNRGQFQEWLKLSVEFLKDEYPDGQLKGVIVHTDEPNPHLHFYAVSNRRDVDAKMLHQAHRAQKIAKKLGKPGVPAFKAEMKAVQDRFFQAVSEPLGLKRKADQQYQRMDRGEYFQQKRLKTAALERDKAYRDSLVSERRQNQALREQNKELLSQVEKKGLVAALGFGKSESTQKLLKAAEEQGFQRGVAQSEQKILKVQADYEARFQKLMAERTAELVAVADRVRESFRLISAENEELKQKNEELMGAASTHREGVMFSQAGQRMGRVLSGFGRSEAARILLTEPKADGLLSWGLSLARELGKLCRGELDRQAALRMEEERERLAAERDAVRIAEWRQEQEEKRHREASERPQRSSGFSGPSFSP